jgi:YfiR/HmsC-like
MNISKFKRRWPEAKRWMHHLIAWVVCLGLWLEPCLESQAEGSLQEYQVKALFLLNFTKYVDWPPTAFAASNSPITIGICGESKLIDALKSVVAGKTVGDRAIVVRQIEGTAALSQCQILFISDSAASQMHEILEKAGGSPILTVGEDDAFGRTGGIINFVLRSSNVRLEIDLAAARKAGLTISSRLLAVADDVKGKPN